MKIDFDALYRNHYQRVFGLCLRLLGRRPQAEDATQEVFVRAYRSLHQYDPEQPFAAWVSSIASHHCIDLIRRGSREQSLFGDESADGAELRSEAPATMDALLEDERGEAVRAAVAGLADKYRLPIVLAYYNEWSYERIAAELGITRNHVGVLLLRGRHLLRAALAAEEDPRR